MHWPNYPSDISAIQRDLLRLIGKNPNQSGSEIQEDLMELYNETLDLAMVYRRINELKERGLVGHEHFGREKRLHLTDEGRQSLEVLHEFDEQLSREM